MKKHIAIIAAAVMALSALTACGTQSNSENGEVAVADAGTENGAGDEGSHAGQNRASAQVTAIDGSNVTLKLAAEPENKEPQGELESGDMNGERPEMSFDGDELSIEITDGMLKTMNMPEMKGDGENPPERPEGEPTGEQPTGEQPQGEKPDGEKPDGEKPQGERPEGNGEQGNFEDSLEDSLEDMDISELAVDDIVNVIYDEDGTTVKYLVKSNRPQ